MIAEKRRRFIDGWGTNSYYSGEMDGYSGSVRKSDDEQYSSGYVFIVK